MLTHLNKIKQPQLVDISDKKVSLRSAKARAIIRFPKKLYSFIKKNDIIGKKGPVITTAILAGIMGVKNTCFLIPLCHLIQIEDCSIESIFCSKNYLILDCTVKTIYKTGAEMEALIGASIAALTIYDMCKAISHDIIIEKIHLLNKSGGKSDV